MFISIKNKGATRTAGHFLGSAQKLFQYSLIFIIQKLRREDNKKFIHLREEKKVFVEKYKITFFKFLLLFNFRKYIKSR